MNKPLRIEDCFVSQHGLRNVDQLEGMIEFVKEGRHFNEESLNPPGPLIKIVQFEDGQKYIQDGHHRMCAMVLADRPFMWPDEYILEHWDYNDYLDINFDCNWVTPYDPRTEVRYPDYGLYKKAVQDFLQKNGKLATKWEFIPENRSRYCTQRNFYHIRALIDRMDLHHLSAKVRVPHG